MNVIFSELMKHDEEVKTFFLRRSVKWPSFILRQTENDFNENDLERHSLLSARVEKFPFPDWLKPLPSINLVSFEKFSHNDTS